MRESAAERGYKGKVLTLAIDDAGATVVEA
jgi:hypothetical protein